MEMFLSRKRALQYVSDIHADVNRTFPRFKPVAPYLAVCGDVGVPGSPYTRDFFKYCADNFEKIFFVPGNHDFDCQCTYNERKVQYYEPQYLTLCSKIGIEYLYKDSRLLGDTLIVGSTLWSNVLSSNKEYSNEEHNSHVKWIESEISKGKETIVLSHFVPSLKLIERKYQPPSSFFVTDLEYLLQPNVKAWLCGHSHSRLSVKVRNTYLGVNAYGYDKEFSSSYPPCTIPLEK